jgi:hypothetical protein
LLIFTYLTISKFFFDATGLTQRPLFFFAIMLMIIGAQFFVTGFVGELIARSAPHRNQYQIERQIGISS